MSEEKTGASGTSSRSDGPQARVSGLNEAPSSSPGTAPPVDDVLLDAGVEIVKRVLLVTAGTIAVLFVLLVIVEINSSSRVAAIEQKIVAAIELNSRKALREDFDFVSTALNRTASEPADTQTVMRGRAAIQTLRNSGALTSDQATVLGECIAAVPPTTHCQPALTAARSLADTSRLDLEALRVFRDIAKDAREHQQSARTLWLQTAQFLLLNLFLPIITALLGYIFGSQRSKT